jgi:hypothetical protein
MLTGNWKTNQYRAADFAKSVLYLAVFACVISAGCKSNRASVKSAEGVSQGEQQLHSAGLSENIHENLFTANANLAGGGSVPLAVSSDSLPAQVLPRRITDMPDVASVAAGNTTQSVDVQTALASVLAAPQADAVEPAIAGPAVKAPVLDEQGMADELISLNFDKVDIHAVLKTIGEITGINFVVDKSVTGPITVMSPTQIRLGDLYGVLESILDVQGYAAVPSGDLVKIVPKADAARRSLRVRIGSDPDQIPQVDSNADYAARLRRRRGGQPNHKTVPGGGFANVNLLENKFNSCHRHVVEHPPSCQDYSETRRYGVKRGNLGISSEACFGPDS